MKKLISLLVVCVLLFSLVTVVSATKLCTVAIGNVDATGIVDTSTKIYVPITMDQVPNTLVNAFQFKIKFDNEKLTFVECAIKDADGNRTVGEWFDAASMEVPISLQPTTVSTVNEQGWVAPTYLCTVYPNGINATTLATSNVLAYLVFTKKTADAKGTVELTFDSAEVCEPISDTENKIYDAASNVDVLKTVAGSIKLSGGSDTNSKTAITMPDVDASSVEEGANFLVPIYLNKLPCENVYAFAIYFEFNSNKLDFISGHREAMVWDSDNEEFAPPLIARGITESTGTGRCSSVIAFNDPTGGSKSFIASKFDPASPLVSLKFQKLPGASGDAEIKITKIIIEGFNSDTLTTYSSENGLVSIPSGETTIHFKDTGTTETDDDFQIDIYRANYLLNSYTGGTMETEYLNFDTPSKTIVDTGKSNGLSSMIYVWKFVTGAFDAAEDPTKIAEFAVEEKDVYEAIIMDLLETSVDSRVMECINNDLTKETADFTELVISDMKNLYQYENISAYKNICTMDNDFIEQLKKTVTDDFEYEHCNASDISKISDFIDKTIEYATELEEYCEKLIAFYDMLQLSESMKTIVQNMHDECPLENFALKTALLECTHILNSSEDEFINIMVAEFFGTVGLNIGEIFFDKMWDNIKDKFMIANPTAFAISAAFKTGKYISNFAFNTDTIAEKYCKLVAVNEMEDLLKKVYNKIKNIYQIGGTIQQAKTYNSTIDLMFKMMDIDCKYSTEYLSETDDNLVAKIKQFWGDNGIDDTIKYVEQLNKKYAFYHEKITTEWIVDIANKDPKIYLQYSSVLKDSIEKQRAYFINCPVDIYVYDKSGNIVGSVVSNVPYCRDDANITISVIDDRKTIYMYGDEYDIVYKGNDTGTMDITITEYDEANSASRNVYFNNLELTEGLTYTSSETGTNSIENVYTLTNESNENIAPDFDSVTDAATETSTATISKGYFADTMAISQELHSGENVDITAYVPEGYKFVNWTSDAECDIFDNANSITTKITMPDYNVNITANLVSVPTLSISSITENSVAVKAKGCENISEGKMILAIYNENEALEQLKTEDYIGEFTFVDLKLTKGKVKVMLWSNLNGLIPLTKATEKLFYFSTTAIE